MNALNFNIKYGLFAGTILIIVKYIILVSFNEVSQTAVMIDYIGVIALAAACYMAVIEKRKNYNQGIITFGEAFMIGMYVSLIAAIMVGIFLYVNAAVIDPQRVERVISKTEEEMRGLNYSEEDIKKAIDNARIYYKPMSQLLMGTTVIIYGLFISLIVAAFTKKNTNTTQV